MSATIPENLPDGTIGLPLARKAALELTTETTTSEVNDVLDGGGEVLPGISREHLHAGTVKRNVSQAPSKPRTTQIGFYGPDEVKLWETPLDSELDLGVELLPIDQRLPPLSRVAYSRTHLPPKRKNSPKADSGNGDSRPHIRPEITPHGTSDSITSGVRPISREPRSGTKRETETEHKIPTKKPPFISRLIPAPATAIIPPKTLTPVSTNPVKQGFFDKIKNAVKQVAEKAEGIVQKYWKSTATMTAAASLAMTVPSDPGKRVLLLEDNPIPTENPISSAEKSTPQETPTSIQNTSVTPRVLTPFEQALGVKKNSTPSHLSLAELVLGKKNQNPPKEAPKEPEPNNQPQTPQAPVTENHLVNNTPTIPMYVFSGNGKTVVATDRDGSNTIDGNEFRLACFDPVGGNREKNTGPMFRNADILGLNTTIFKKKNLSFSEIAGVTPVTETFTVDGLTYTISAKTDAALKIGEEILTHSKQEAKKTAPVKAKEEKKELEIPRAILVEDPENTDSLPSPNPTEVITEGVLPSREILPVIEHDENMMTHRAMRYRTTLEYVLRNGKYEGGSYTLMPETPEEARLFLDGCRGTVDAIREASKDPTQQHLTLEGFFIGYITIVDAEQNKLRVSIDDIMKRAGYTDLQVAKAKGKKIPANVIDDNPHDGKLPQLVGTWDKNGWEEARDLILEGVKRIYGEFPTTEQLDEYFRNNVSLDKHPEINTWFKFLLQVDREMEKGQE